MSKQQALHRDENRGVSRPHSTVSSTVSSTARSLGYRAFFSTLFVFTLCITACAPQHAIQYRADAPTSPDSVGVLAQFEKTADLQSFVESHPGVQVRSIHDGTHLVEIFNTDISEVAKASPIYLKQNIYFKKLVGEDKHEAIEQKITEFTQDCQQTEDALEAKIESVSMPIDDLNEKIIEKKGALKFSALKTVGREPADRLAYLWVMVGPEESQFELNAGNGATLEVSPDLAGGYTILLIAKDSQHACAKDMVEFGVTQHAKYLGPKKPRAFSASERDLFKHLQLIDAEQAWTLAKGDGVKIAVIDTGMNYNHPDLSANVYVNKKEVPNNNIDDDHNGFVDDVNGWNFVDGSNMPYDDQMHGTHVSGLAASGVSGIAPHAQIMPLKALNAMGGGDLGSIIGAIMYAADNGADVINMSLGSYVPEELTAEMQTAVNYAEKKGSLIVAASGNGHPQTGIGMDTDRVPNYPSAFTNANILAVSAVGIDGKLSSYSNFGLKSVDVAAPGGDKPDGGLYSAFLYPEKKLYVQAMGTSMACPVTAGLAALVKSANPKLTAVQVKKVIMDSVTKKPEFRSKMVSGGLINPVQAVQMAKTFGLALH